MSKAIRTFRGGAIALAIGLVCGLSGLVGAVAYASPDTLYTLYVERTKEKDGNTRLEQERTGYETCKDVPIGDVCEINLSAKQWRKVLTDQGMPKDGDNAPTDADIEAYLKSVSVLASKKDPLREGAWAKDMIVFEQESAAPRLNKRIFNAFANKSINDEITKKKDSLDKRKEELLKAKEEAKTQGLKDEIDAEIAKIEKTKEALTPANVKDETKGAELKKNLSEIPDEVAALKEKVEKEKRGETTEPANNQELDAAKAELQKSVDEGEGVSADENLPAEAKEELDAEIAEAKKAKDAPDATVESVKAAKEKLDAAIAKARKAIEDKKAATPTAPAAPADAAPTAAGGNNSGDKVAPEKIEKDKDVLATTGLDGNLLAGISLLSLVLIGIGAVMRRRTLNK